MFQEAVEKLLYTEIEMTGTCDEQTSLPEL